MRLRDQALILALAGLCLGCGGCARVLGALFTPQDTLLSTTSQAANQLTAPAQNEVAGLGREVDRLLAGNGGNRSELDRIRQELNQRGLREPPRQGAAQDEMGRSDPWHPRQAGEPTGPGGSPLQDHLAVGRSQPQRLGLLREPPPPGPLPDGIAPGELLRPMELSGRLHRWTP